MAEPKVRFRQDDGSSFPSWQTIPMSEVFTEITEKNHPEMPVLSVQQGIGTVLRDSSDRNILYDKSNLKSYKAMKKDDYIIHLRSFEGGLECSNYDGISSPAYRILRPKSILPAAYRDYFRSHEFIHNKLAVSVVGIRDGKNIDMNTFWQIPMTVPCIEEQQKIAEFLSSVDEVIVSSEQEVANLETMKKAVMKKIFSQVVRFKKEDGTDFPVWEEKEVAEVCSKLCVGFVGTCEKYYTDAQNGIPMYRTGNIKNGQITCDDMKYVTKEFHQKNKKSQLRSGDVLIARFGDNGLGAIYNCVEEANCLNCIIAHPDEQILLVKYFQEFLGSDVAKKQVSKEVVGSTFGILNTTSLGGLTIVYPCLEEQRLIADFLSNFDEAIAAAKKELELWKKLKKGLLQQMFV